MLKRWQLGGGQEDGCALVLHSQEGEEGEVMEEF